MRKTIDGYLISITYLLDEIFLMFFFQKFLSIFDFTKDV